MKRIEAVQAVADRIPEGALVVSCNGMISRELYSTGDAPGRFYMIGSMGLASSIGLGLADARPDRPIVVLDGDGNVLMGLGALASIAVRAPANFYHLVLDNGVHASTGGQRTISGEVRLEEIARACGYPRAVRATDPEELQAALDVFFDAPGPAMLLAAVEPGNLAGVPRMEIPPEELATRFRAEAMRREDG